MTKAERTKNDIQKHWDFEQKTTKKTVKTSKNVRICLEKRCEIAEKHAKHWFF